MGAHVIAHRSYDRSTMMLVSFGQVPCDMVLRIAPSRRPPVPRMRLWVARAKARSRFRETQEALNGLRGVRPRSQPGLRRGPRAEPSRDRRLVLRQRAASRRAGQLATAPEPPPFATAAG